MRFIALPALATCALLSACSDGKGDRPYRAGPGDFSLKWEEPGPRLSSPRLTRVASCADAEKAIEDAVVLDNQRSLALYLRWAEDFQYQPARNQAESSASNDSADAKAAAPADYTRGNDQVQGVEEADFVKNGATVAYQLSGEKLHVLRTWPAESLGEIATVELPGTGTQMVLDEAKGRLVVFSQVSEVSAMHFVPDATSTFVTTYDVREPEAPKALDTVSLGGQIQGVRRVGDAVRIVLSSYQRYPEGVISYPSDDRFWAWSRETRAAWAEEIAKANEAKIREQSLAFWLRYDGMARVAEDGTRTPLFAEPDCARIHAPVAPSKGGLTRGVTLDLETRGVSEEILLTQSDRVYASEKSLYVASSYHWWDDQQKDTDYTFVHKFDASDPVSLRYVGSGGLEGTVSDQFSLDEHEGVLRVAATVSVRTRSSGDGEAARWTSWQTLNRVYTLSEKDGALVELGRTPDLAPGERIFSARFAGSRGYVVTFRLVDPLFVLDLSNPAAPKVTGELKIPGFSTYIHPIDDAHLLTIGRDADPETGIAGRVKISIFDVGNGAAPREAQSKILEGDLWTSAEWDHRAFLYYPSRKLLALPTSDWKSWNAQSTGVHLYEIDREAGVSPRGFLDLSDLRFDDGVSAGCYWDYSASAKRAFFADDYVYAMTDAGVRVASVSTPHAPLASVRYTR